MAAEAIWTRTLRLLFGASVYALSIIVAVFLVGLGIGSSIGSLLCRTLKQPRLALGWSQLLRVRDRMDRVQSWRIIAVLARQPVDLL